jgi:hypothetical protein
LVDDVGHGGRRHGQDRQVDVVGDMVDSGVGTHTRDELGVRVDRVDRPLEAGPEQVDEGGVTDGARISTRGPLLCRFELLFN